MHYIRPTYSSSSTYLLIFLLTYTVGSVRINPAISLKRLKIERKLLLMAYIESYTGFRLPPKYDLWAQAHWFLKCRKMKKYSLVMTPMPCRVAGSIISIRPTDLCAHALACLLTYNTYNTQTNQCFWWLACDIVFTAQCTLVHMRGLGIACRPSVCLSVRL